MKKIAFVLFLTAFSSGFAQSTIEGYIFDQSTKEPLPYATIRLVKNGVYTITNEDGKFEIKSKITLDSLEVTYIGYKTKKIPVSYFLKNSKLYLFQNILSLDEVTLIVYKNKDHVYNLLDSLIRKYRNKRIVSESKTFLTLTSSSRNIPIEHIESFYNSKQSLSKGIIDLKIKSGRFGQNKPFPFYSLNNTTILSDFQFFRISKQILPLYPGNVASDFTRRKFNVKIDKCSDCSSGDISISFVPKKHNGRLFYGKFLFNREKLIIKKIELKINDPIIKDLSSIIQNDIITPKEIELNIIFNPLDFEKIQYLDLSFTIYYNSKNLFEIIKSDSFLYFYDYGNSFDEPYFTNIVHFNNDYDKIIALQASDDFWNTNYQFPKSYNEKKSMDFMKKNGFMINYENTIASDHIQHIKPSVISWSKNNLIEWKIIKKDLTSSINQGNYAHNNQNLRKNLEADRVTPSNFEIVNKFRHSDIVEEFNFSYALDQFENEKGEKQFVTRTIFDRNSSFCTYDRTKNKLVYVNLVFDIYEYYRQSLENKITDNMTFEKMKKMCKNKFEEASITVKKLKKETNSGKNYQNLMQWNNKINLH